MLKLSPVIVVVDLHIVITLFGCLHPINFFFELVIYNLMPIERTLLHLFSEIHR